MAKALLVWYLIIQGYHCAGFVTQLGPYADQQSCHNAMSIIGNHFDKNCVQVLSTETKQLSKGK